MNETQTALRETVEAGIAAIDAASDEPEWLEAAVRLAEVVRKNRDTLLALLSTSERARDAALAAPATAPRVDEAVEDALVLMDAIAEGKSADAIRAMGVIRAALQSAAPVQGAVDDDARWVIFAEAFGLSLEPSSERIPADIRGRYKYQHTEDAWKAWCKARDASLTPPTGGPA